MPRARSASCPPRWSTASETADPTAAATARAR
jgi:hypothetical protein